MENDQSPFLKSLQPIDIIEGDIISPTNRNDLSTLDEPVFETIKRLYYHFNIYRKFVFIFTGDLFAVLRKFSHALLPRQSSSLLQQWDLWGPLILITTLAILLESHATKASNGVQFAEVFSLMFIGAIVVTVGH
jgi:hypothetical protein